MLVVEVRRRVDDVGGRRPMVVAFARLVRCEETAEIGKVKIVKQFSLHTPAIPLSKFNLCFFNKNRNFKF